MPTRRHTMLDCTAETIYIPLQDSGVTIVSPEDADLLLFDWLAIDCNGTSYVVTRTRRKRFDGRVVTRSYYLHRVILQRMLGHRLSRGQEVDHRDMNTFNNCRENLRLATRAQNIWNRGLNKRNTTGYKGVTFHKARGKFMSIITVNGEHHYLGYFETAEQAHQAYSEAAIKYHGEFVRLK